MTPRRGRQRRGGARSRRRGIVAVVGAVVVLIVALSFVVWRQARGVEMEQALRTVETERAIAEAELVTLNRRVEELRSRTRIMRVAAARFGMYVPADREIVFLPAVKVEGSPEMMTTVAVGRAP